MLEVALANILTTHISCVCTQSNLPLGQLHILIFLYKLHYFLKVVKGSFIIRGFKQQKNMPPAPLNEAVIIYISLIILEFYFGNSNYRKKITTTFVN